MTAPYYDDGTVTVHAGDCLDVLPTLPDASVDAVVCDPPYNLGFMGKEWDTPGSFFERKPVRSTKWDHVGGNHNPVDSADAARTRQVEGVKFGQWCEEWAAECLRVLKPGGHLVAFGGTRTYHRLVCAIEDAGFEIRDSIHWTFGAGFPKSLDVSKAIDRRRDDRKAVKRVAAFLSAAAERAGFTAADLDAAFGFAGHMAGQWMTQADWVLLPKWEQWQRLRELLGFGDDMDAEVWRLNGRKGTPGHERPDRVVTDAANGDVYQPVQNVLAPGTPVLADAARWQGWGTALKPAHEPIVLARKPLAGTVAANVLQHGTGALNIDGCRTPAGQDYRDKCASVVGLSSNRNGDAYGEWTGARTDSAHPAGRWPTNVVFSHAPLLDEVGEPVGDACADGCVPGCPVAELDRQSGVRKDTAHDRGRRHGSVYGDGKGPSGLNGIRGVADEGGASRFFPAFRYEAKAPASERPRVDGVAHETVKPLALMRWLVRLVTPPGGTVLDPFLGSGTTAEACVLEGFRCVGIERDERYLPLIRARLSKPLQPSLGFEEGIA